MAITAGAEQATQLLSQLGSKTHLEREKAIGQLQRLIHNGEVVGKEDFWDHLKRGVIQLLQDEVSERRLGGLKTAKVIFLSTRIGLEEFEQQVMVRSMELLEDVEVRVRLEVGECLGILARNLGDTVYVQCGPTIIKSIQENMNRDDHDASSQTTSQDDFLSNLLTSSYKTPQPGQGELRHHTEGWKCLETSFKALHKIICELGPKFSAHLTQELVQLTYTGLGHLNRFIRETGFHVLGEMFKVKSEHVLTHKAAQKLCDGLSDNWSQVRYASSVATRTFFQNIDQTLHQQVLPILLPPMCLNRYYVAEGVRQYSQETWKVVMGDQGAELVGKYCDEVVKYYIGQSKANNHAVREAACACIAELMHKVDGSKVAPHVLSLIGALVNCFKDASWPVRDAACLACGRCVLAFPKESRQVLDELYQLWIAHLEDNIYSVREDSAVALSDVVRAYGSEATDILFPILHLLLPKAKQQPSDSKRYSGLENTTTFGVAARRARDNDEQLHTNQTMFSCGSLAPKLQRGGGCIDHGFKRPKEPWEASDGAVYLVRELANVVGEEVGQFLIETAEIARLDHFAHCYNLRETICKALPVIAKGMGKKKFKPYLEHFIPPLFNTLHIEHQLARVAAGKAIGFLRDFYGPNILAGRLTEEQNRELQSNQNIPELSVIRQQANLGLRQQ